MKNTQLIGKINKIRFPIETFNIWNLHLRTGLNIIYDKKTSLNSFMKDRKTDILHILKWFKCFPFKRWI